MDLGRSVKGPGCQNLLGGKGVQVSQEGNLQGAGCPHMPKHMLMYKKVILAEQRALAGILGEKETVSPLEEGEGSLGELQGYCEVIQGKK